MHILVRGVWRREEPSVRRAWLLGNEAVLFSPERRATASQGPCGGDLVAFPAAGLCRLTVWGFPAFTLGREVNASGGAVRLNWETLLHWLVESQWESRGF